MKTILIALLGLTLMPRVAQAQDAPFQEAPPVRVTEESSDQARQHFEEGLGLLETRRFADAARAFERALELRETAPILFNLGLAYRGMGKLRRAITAFGRFLDVAGPRHAALRSTASELRAELEASIGVVVLVVRGGSTEVKVDGEAIEGHDGTHELLVDPGRHVFEATRPGFRPANLPIEVGRGQRLTVELDASQNPTPGQLAIETGLPRAEIRIDGRIVGHGEYSTDLPAGQYEILVRAEGRQPQRRTISLRPGALQRVSLTLPPPPESRGLHERWWFWGGIAVVVTGAVLGAIYLVDPPVGDFDDGSLGFTVQALTR